MRRRTAVLCALLLLLGLGVVVLPASAVQAPHGGLVSANPADNTPHVLDGEVFAIAQVGNKIVLGGTFTQARNATGSTITRNRILSFDRTTGQIDIAFAPSFNTTVRALVPGPGNTVYVAGQFTTMNGASVPKVVQLNVGNGTRIGTFAPGAINAGVEDMKLSGSRLFIGGYFSTVAGQPRTALAELDPTTGALRSTLNLAVAGTHNGGSTFVHKFDVTPDGSTMVVTGNFRTINGQDRVQVGMLDLTTNPVSVANWQTDRWKPLCFSSFQYYLNDVDISPDGSFFVLTSYGGYGSGPPTLCDTTSRWETGERGAGRNPSWADYSGGDSVYAVAITGSVVYIGGHHRWTNNPFASDAVGQGAVDRQGIAALDPVNGVPLSWNPSRTRGRAVFDLLATSDGLWVGSDTDRIGNFEYHARIAFFPLTGGKSVPQPAVPALPVDVGLLGSLPGTVGSDRYLYRVNAGGDTIPAVDNGPDWVGDVSPPGANYRNTGNGAGWSAVPTVDGSVPASTPLALFSSERWDGGDTPEMQWEFPVTAGKTVQVRLFLSNRCGCTAGEGQRVFDVAIDGDTVLDDYDIVDDVNHDVGTMKEFDVTSDGTIDIDFGHVVENPLVNGIEIIDPSIPVGDASAFDSAKKRAFDGVTVGVSQDLPASPTAWGQVRGAFFADGRLYSTWSDGSWTSRPYNGTSFGTPTTLDLHGLSNAAAEAQVMTGLFYDGGRVYFTLANDPTLHYRYFSVESGIVGAQRFDASGPVAGMSWSQVGGMFVANGGLYWVDRAVGSLHRLSWSGGTVGGPDVVVSGPGLDEVDWRSRALFTYPGSAPNPLPTAVITSSCTGTSCTFDSSSSSDPNGTIASRVWSFGDGTTSTAVAPPHAYAVPGSYTVTLTVTDNGGGQGSTSKTLVLANAAPVASFTSSCSGLSCTFDGAASADPDGSISSFAWDFGDDATGSGQSTSHTFSAAGSYSVVLQVTDNRSATASSSATVTVQPVATTVSFAGSAASTSTSTTTAHGLTVPAAVQAGDVMVLAASFNGAGVTASDPAGWVRQSAANSSSQTGVLWTRTATASDAGSGVQVTTTTFVRGSVVLSAYRGGQLTAGSGVLTAETVSRTGHTTPTRPAAAGAWVVSYWADKSAATSSWTPPAGTVVRQTGAGTGAGHLSWLLADSGGPVAAGTVGGLTATADSASMNAVMGTVVVSPT